MKDKARFAAYTAVKRIFGGAYSNLLTFDKDLAGIDRAFAESIVLGTLERKITLEYVISLYAERAIKNDVKALLMTGIYQILYMDKVPASAACDETVEIAKRIFGKSTAGFINAVLRSVSKDRKTVLEKIDSEAKYIKYSADMELYDLIESQYGESSERIFESFFGSAPTFLRVNCIRSDAESVANKTGGSVIGEKTVRCDNTQEALIGLECGEYYVQGLGSQKATELLGAREGDTVIDVCACPGGKSLAAAIDMSNRGNIYSFDIHENKLPLIEKSAKRLGITIISTAKQDARFAKEELLGVADKVICDVPCSGTGVMGSKPEIKYKKPKDFEGIYRTQSAIINSASKYLKIGGTMVYSTCSINKLENEDIVKKFISENVGYKLIEEHTYMPYEDTHEGFYAAKIIREK